MLQMPFHDVREAFVESQWRGMPKDWERSLSTQGTPAYIRALAPMDEALKARLAARYHAHGFIPHFFQKEGQHFVALEGIHADHPYATIEEAFVQQILGQA
jgi:hypothetical protein